MGCSATKDLRTRLESEGHVVELITYGCLSGGCQYLGFTSKGIGQMKGNGVLALTDKVLILKGFAGVEDFECEIKSITNCEVVNKYPNGVAVVPLLKITFATAQTSTDDLFVCVQPQVRQKWVEKLVEFSSIATKA